MTATRGCVFPSGVGEPLRHDGKRDMSKRIADRRLSTCDVERGLYVLRYTASPSEPCPAAELRVRRGSMDIVAAPGQDDAILTRPGQAVVIVAHTSAVFDIEVVAAPRGGGADASFSLDLIASGTDERPQEAPPRHAPARELEAPLSGGEPGLDVGAHVSRRGDVTARADEWIAGPGMVLPIEGLSIRVDDRDLAIDIRVQTERHLGEWSNWQRDGAFAGTRQRAEALTAIGLSLRGAQARDYRICAEVMHLGSAPQVREGQQVEFTGVDPIVGFRIGLKRVIDHQLRDADPRGGLRVFRAHRHQSTI